MSFDYFSQRRMQYILEKLKAIFDTKADSSDIPTVGDGTLTIKRNGSTVQSFSANSDTDVNADIEVPEVWTGTMAEYIQQASQIADGTQINITDDFANGVPVGLADIYSTEERQVGVYTDGKPIYQKTFHFTSGWSLGNWEELVDLSSLGIERLINSKGIFTRASGGVTIQLTFDGSIEPESVNNPLYKVSVRYNNNGKLECLVMGYNDVTYIDITFQYTKTNDEAWSGIVPLGYNRVALADCYSTEEREIGCWVDGKPIYQIVFNNLNFTLTASVWNTITGINIPNGKDLIKFIAYGEFNEQYMIPLEEINLDSLTGTVQVKSTTTRTITAAAIQYTKTTDVAGSGTWVPSGNYAIHYSNEEQVIGTWTDGSTLYQRTFTLTGADAPLNGTPKGVDIGANNNIKSINGYLSLLDEVMPINYYYDGYLNCNARLVKSEHTIYIVARIPDRTCSEASLTVTYTKTTT